MAHQITQSDRFAENRLQGARAWHGLGVALTEEQQKSAVEAGTAIGLAWGTELLPVFADRVTPNGVERIEIPTSRLQVRADNGDPLGLVSDGYKRFENIEGLRFADTILDEAGGGAHVETIGSLYGGRRVFAMLALDRTIEAAPGDRLKPYINFSWGHGGFASIQANPTAVRVVCANTIAQADQDRSLGVRMMHTGDLAGKLATARMLLGYAKKSFDTLEATVRHLAATAMTGDQCKDFMNRAFDAMFPRPDESEDVAKWEAKKADTFVSWRELFANERNNGMPAIRGTFWAALNTVTEWVDHVRGRTSEGSDVRVHSNLFGVGREAKAQVQRLAVAMAK